MMNRLQLAALAGCALIILYSLQFYRSGFFLRIAAIGVVIGGASAFVGFLLGFVFCIPRTAKQSDAIVASSTEPHNTVGEDHVAAKSIAMAKSNIETNTNLVDISDWLTKILVGVGLVELNTIPDRLKTLAAYLGRGLRECDSNSCIQSSESFALSIVIFFFGAGFLIGYLWTRLYYQDALQASERLGRMQSVLGRVKGELAVTKVELANKDKFWSNATDEVTNIERLLAQNHVDDALKLVEDVLRDSPEDALAWLLKGRIFKKKAGSPPDRQRLQEALQYATKAAELMPDRGGPRYNMACYQALLGFDRAEILKNLKRALELNPKLKEEAPRDSDLKSLWEDKDFKELTGIPG